MVSDFPQFRFYRPTSYSISAHYYRKTHQIWNILTFSLKLRSCKAENGKIYMKKDDQVTQDSQISKSLYFCLDNSPPLILTFLYFRFRHSGLMHEQTYTRNNRISSFLTWFSQILNLWEKYSVVRLFLKLTLCIPKSFRCYLWVVWIWGTFYFFLRAFLCFKLVQWASLL